MVGRRDLAPVSAAYRPANELNSAQRGMAMAYIISSAVDFRHNLKYEFEGGDRDKAIDSMFFPNGRPINGGGLTTCIRYSIPLPAELLDAVPQRIIVTPCKDGFVPDFGYSAKIDVYIVSDRFVDLIELLEPGMHQFIQIPDVIFKRQPSKASSFYLANIMPMLSAIDVERSKVEWHTLPGGGESFLIESLGPLKDAKITLKKSIIANHHLWKGSREHFSGYIFCSNVLREKMQSVGLSPLYFRECEEV